MKRILLSALLLAFGISAFAQKSYVNIVANSLSNSSSHKLYLTGDVPPGISNIYYQSSDYMTIGVLLNLLAEKGFEVEFVTPTGEPDLSSVCYVLSKKKSDSSNAVRMIESDDDSDIHEVARYNLQGMPISENEKGVQIVVYSNYTTKTVIKE